MATKPPGWLLPHLQAWRLRRYLTQRELARVSGVSFGTVCRAEIGGRVSADTVKKLATALKITPDALCYTAPDRVAV